MERYTPNMRPSLQDTLERMQQTFIKMENPQLRYSDKYLGAINQVTAKALWGYGTPGN